MIRRIGCLLLGLLLLTVAVSAQETSTPTPHPQYYTVAPGDTLSSIALRYHTTTLALMRANGIANADRVLVGAVLIIPVGGFEESNAIVTTEEVPAPTATRLPSATPSEAPPSATPTDTLAPATLTPAATEIVIPPTAAPSIGFELGGEIFGFEHLNLLRQTGMTWAKVSLHWKTGDTPDAAGKAIQQAHASQVKILLEISGDGQQFRADPSGYTQQFVDYLGQVAAFAPDALEVWGGMNAASISASDYAGLLSAAFLSIKRANLQVLVISGALEKVTALGAQCTSSGCGEVAYLSALAEAGIGNAADCIGLSYTLGAVSPDSFSGDPRGDDPDYYYPALVNTYASIFPTKPLCFTALGYLVTGQIPLANRFAWAQNTTPDLRADWLARAALLAYQSGRIRLMIVYNLDATTNGDSAIPQTGYAILNETGDCSACKALATSLKAQ